MDSHTTMTSTKKPIKLTEERKRRLMSQKYAYSLLCNNQIVPSHIFVAMARDSEHEQALETYANIYGCELDNTINSLKYIQESLKSLSSTPETNDVSTFTSAAANFIPIPPEVLIKALNQAELIEIELRNRRNERIKALENLPANLSNEPLKQRLAFDDDNKPVSNPKLKAIRNNVFQYSPMYNKPQRLDDILQYRRPEEKVEYTLSYIQKREQDRIQKKINKKKAKRNRFLFQIKATYADYVTISELMRDKKLAFGRAVLNYHASVQKEQQRKQDKFQRERLNALKNDDEEAYMKLIDETKDTRLSHLLKQTDQYLEKLAKAVSTQQNEPFNNNSMINTHFVPSTIFSSPVIDEDNIIETTDGKKIDYYQVAHRIKEEVKQPLILKGGILKEYQLKGLEWMVSLYNNRLNGILADEMGLGKTIQTISLITCLIEKKKQNGPFLIIVPLSTLTNWIMELEKWAPDVKKIVYKGGPNERKNIQLKHLKHIDFQVFLTTYEYVIRDNKPLSRVNWLYVIVDEGHRMKNVNSKLSMNNLPELWSLLNFVLPKIFNSLDSFDEWFNTPFANTGGQDKIALNEEETLLIIRRLHKVLRPFLLRRLKKDVESELPDKVERVIKVKLSALQVKLYNQMKTHGAIFVNKGEKG
ncbi:18303_t:CDS:2 [Entrophospora sp. SA101]|nr:18303_t:CDS:2 [Entrophospora sp. SA101]CAJ0862966.1 3861_t:CDS:2 [Entrophospora sp. SA101]